MYYSLSNAYSSEGTASGVATVITFPWKTRKVTITNDSSINNLSVSITNNTITLKPLETLSVAIGLRTLSLTGSGAYRVWAFG